MANYTWNGKPTDDWTQSSAYNQFGSQMGMVPLMGFGNGKGTEIPFGVGAQAGANAGATAGSGKLGAMFGKAWNYVRDPRNFGYSLRGNEFGGPGLTVFGKNIGKYATAGAALMQGLQAAQGISGYSRGRQNLDSLKSDIIRSAAANPLVSNYLTSDQMNTLNQIRRGTYASNPTFDDVLGGVGSEGISNALSGAMMGAAGGLPGIAIGAIGGLVNGGISGANQGNERKIADLQALYDALAEAETSYKSMRRPVFTGLGIQRNYQNMYA